MSMPSKANFQEAQKDLIDAADYLKTALDEGHDIYESQWLDRLMDVHRVLCEAAEAATGADQPPPASS